MIIYFIVGIFLLLNLINPKLLWYIDFWKYNGDKPEPSFIYMNLIRFCSGLGLVILITVLISYNWSTR